MHRLLASSKRIWLFGSNFSQTSMPVSLIFLPFFFSIWGRKVLTIFYQKFFFSRFFDHTNVYQSITFKTISIMSLPRISRPRLHKSILATSKSIVGVNRFTVWTKWIGTLTKKYKLLYSSARILVNLEGIVRSSPQFSAVTSDFKCRETSQGSKNIIRT